MHAFCIRPNISFDIQDTGEEVILFLRAHPITQLYWIVNGLILSILLIVLNFIFPTIFTPQQIFFINIAGIFFIGAYLWANFLTYFFNVGIVTNKRVIDIDFHAIIYKETTEADLGKIEDITAKSGGYFASLFNFGDVFIQTAGTEVNIEFLKIPRPSEVVNIINHLAS